VKVLREAQRRNEMSQRDEVISVVDYHNGLSWSFNPDECSRWFNRYGVLVGKLLMLRAFLRGLKRAGETHQLLKRAKP